MDKIRASIRGLAAKLKAWIDSHGGYTKVGAGVIVLTGFAYAGVPAFHDACVAAWSAVPTTAKTTAVTVWTLYCWFRNPATQKVIETVFPKMGPGDKLKIEDPALAADGTLSASSATLQKAEAPKE